MVEVNNKAIRDMMIDLYPNEVSQKSGSQEIEINNELNENKRALNSPNIIENMKKTRISINSDNFVHPVLKIKIIDLLHEYKNNKNKNL